MKTIIFTFCLLASSISTYSQTDIISQIGNKLSEYYQFYPSEKIQISTNKEVYMPEEVIWFSIQMNNSNELQNKSVIPEFEISLYAIDGTRISGDIFKTEGQETKGDLRIPERLQEGQYVLVASSPQMKHGNEAFYKLIYISPKNERSIRLTEIGSTPLLESGKTTTFSFVVESMSGEASKNIKLKYKLQHKDETILSDKIKTNEKGEASINLSLQNNLYEQPLVLHISTNKKELNYSKTLALKNQKINIDFFAEGGHFTPGIPQRIGFAVSNQLGQPINIEGEITNELNEVITKIKTSISGCGVIPMIAKQGVKYTLNITSEIGYNQKFELPKATLGFSFAVSKLDTDYIYANIIPGSETPQNIYLLATKGASVVWASEITVNGSMRLKIPKDDFPPGISMLSVFNKKQQILGNRLVYIEQKAAPEIKLTAPETVKAGETFQFTIETDNQLQASQLNLSISASCENTNWPNQVNSWHLINSDLDSEIPNINKLLGKQSSENIINYILISKHLKNFRWNKILHFDQEQYQKKAQQTGTSGIVIDKNGKPVPKAKVSFMNSKNMQTIHVSSDNNGEFSIQSPEPDKLNNFTIHAIAPNGNEDLKVEFEKSMTDQISKCVVAFVTKNAAINQFQFDSDFYIHNKALFSKLKPPKKVYPKKEESYKKMLQNATSLLDVIKVIKPFRMDGDLIIFPGGTNSINAQDGALIVVDGQKMGTSASVLNSFSPFDIESINISTQPIDIQRYTGLNSVGVIVIETKKGLLEKTENTVIESPYEDGFRIPRDFWVENMKYPNSHSTTLLWNPSVSIVKNGIWEFEVTSNDVIGEFQIRVNTINEEGNVSSVLKTFEVIK